MITIHLPWPPSVNQYWRSRTIIPKNPKARPTSTTYVTHEGKAFRKAAAKRSMTCGARGLGGRLSVRVVLHAPDRRKRDLDNHLKGLLDAITDAGVWVDDSQIDRLVVERGPVLKNGSAVVMIEEMDALRPVPLPNGQQTKCPTCGAVRFREGTKELKGIPDDAKDALMGKPESGRKQ